MKLKKKIYDHDDACYITTQEFNKLPQKTLLQD